MYEIQIFVSNLHGIKIKECFGIDRRKNKDEAMRRWDELKDEYEGFHIFLVEWLDDEGRQTKVLEQYYPIDYFKKG